MLFHVLLLGSLAARISGYRGASNVENLIIFGDSYTDEGRLNLFIASGGVPPPPGTVIPHSNVTAAGSYTWPYYASQKLGAATYNYAISGAVCSNEIIYRYFEQVNGPFPSVIDYQIEAWKADVKYASTASNTTFLKGRTPENSAYALWIGTNDLGNGGFLLEQQTKGKTIDDYIDCVWSLFDGVYSTGGRRFVLFTQAPLDQSPLYKSIPDGGTGDIGYWTDKETYNTTAYEGKMLEYTTTVDTIFDYGAPFQLLVKKRWPGASFTILNTHQIILDIIATPDKYLDAPANVTGFYYTCPDPLSQDGCADSQYPLTSFLWYDSLHPSSRTQEIIGLELAKALEGNSSYATYYS
ncbi:carbohydrate esterase family 16 protein [Xylaria sp. FL0043]|nr:carbohydrate esterase family 16 protein [Xylaria sp. FL0043]